MNGTPRLSSRFPETPQPRTSRPLKRTPLSDGSASRSNLPAVPSLHRSAATDGPLIPLDAVDAPQQRLLVVSFYVALFAWRLYDFHNLVEEETESLWMFMKWVAVDGIFLFGLPELRIPWLEWSSNVMALTFLCHACLNAILMFRIPIPLGAALMGLSRLVYDREVTISGSKVKYANVIHDSNLLLGRQIIKILPEGSATLNPGKKPFCLSAASTQVYLPIRLNQTEPITLNLVRFDLETNQNETTTFSSAQIKKMIKDAKKDQSGGIDGLHTIRIPVKKAGLYKLGKVVDKTGLEVRRRIVGETAVVPCPKAAIRPLSQNKCLGELSNVELEVTGTPPLSVKYRKTTNHQEHNAQLQGIKPDDLVSPLAQADSQAIIKAGQVDASWARSRSVTVPLSESLTTSGKVAFSLQEVEDALGNKISFSSKDYDKEERQHSQAPHLFQVMTVHERPTAVLNGCSPQNPLKVARGREVGLPVRLGSTGKEELKTAYNLEFLFTPESQLSIDGDHSDHPQIQAATMRNRNEVPRVKEAGLYTLKSVSTEFCTGEVLEPASCLLQNPPEPSLQISHQEVYDKCAQKAVGLRVDFHLTGTPPFKIACVTQKKGGGPSAQFFDIHGLRGVADLTPPTAGHYSYHFTEISDATYQGHSLESQNLILEQDVKPAAHASFDEKTLKSQEAKVCIDKSVSFDVNLRGEGPFTVEYELVRGSNRKAFKVGGINDNKFKIETEPLTKGGDYTLSLSSVTDGMGCKETLGQETKINVLHQKPKAGFGLIEGSRTIRTLEGSKVALPLKLTGEGPWTVQYQKIGDSQRLSQQIRQPNDKIDVNSAGTYELVSMHDRFCPGTVDSRANSIRIDWISRPSLKLVDAAFKETNGNTYIKHEICEGEEDSADLHLNGSPPFEVKYKLNTTPLKGAKSLTSRSLNTAGGVSSIRMDTTHPGLVEYEFSQLTDSNYEHSKAHFSGMFIQQRVNPKPTVHFSNPGKTYSYCSSHSSKIETIPITLTGTPPFKIDYEIRHSGKSNPRIHTISDINGHSHNIEIPSSELTAGTSAVLLRKVTDSRTCTRTLPSTEPRVQISVHAAPSVAPLDIKKDYCVGDRLGFSLSGTAPFTIFYTFDGKARKASSPSTTFRRLAEKPGEFEITAVSDSGSGCKADIRLAATVHPLPSARISDGRETEQDIHEGGSADIEFKFGGEGPWEFTWVRSRFAGKGKRGEVLEMRSETSEEDTFKLRAGEEGVYEIVRVKDRWCEVRREGVEVGKEEPRKRLTN